MFNVSIVLYHPLWKQVNKLCQELLQVPTLRYIYLVDNSPNEGTLFAPQDTHIKYIWNDGKNLGYGSAHNLAIRHSIYLRTAYHLVMNADVWITAQDLTTLYHYLEQHDKVGLLIPHTIYPSGTKQYVARLLPTPFDMFGRRFLPSFLITHRNAQFELHNAPTNQVINVPNISGCFMFMRTEAIRQARLFDEEYFMYMEDVDLTRRIHQKWQTVLVPEVTITHNHARDSYKHLRQTLYHIRSAFRYFNKWGWFRDAERDAFNRATLAQLQQQQTGAFK